MKIGLKSDLRFSYDQELVMRFDSNVYIFYFLKNLISSLIELRSNSQNSMYHLLVPLVLCHLGLLLFSCCYFFFFHIAIIVLPLLLLFIYWYFSSFFYYYFFPIFFFTWCCYFYVIKSFIFNNLIIKTDFN